SDEWSAPWPTPELRLARGDRFDASARARQPGWPTSPDRGTETTPSERIESALPENAAGLHGAGLDYGPWEADLDAYRRAHSHPRRSHGVRAQARRRDVLAHGAPRRPSRLRRGVGRRQHRRQAAPRGHHDSPPPGRYPRARSTRHRRAPPRPPSSRGPRERDRQRRQHLAGTRDPGARRGMEPALGGARMGGVWGRP